jgi:hypothetical protein
MKFLILILALGGHIQSVSAQETGKQVKSSKPKGDLNCVYKSKFSVLQRATFYPYRVAESVKLISFRYHRNNIPLKGDSVIADSLIESKVLSKHEIDQLSDIIYNNFYKKQPNYGVSTQCFLPRNAILFSDKSGKTIGHVLICFHCDRHKESSDEINWGDECSQKMENIRQFFISKGVKFGTDKTIDNYPGETNNDEGL